LRQKFEKYSGRGTDLITPYTMVCCIVTGLLFVANNPRWQIVIPYPH